MTFKELLDESVIKCNEDQFMTNLDAKNNFVHAVKSTLDQIVQESKWDKCFIVMYLGKTNKCGVEVRNSFNESNQFMEFRIKCSKFSIKRKSDRYKASGYKLLSMKGYDEIEAQDIFNNKDILAILNDIEE